VAICQCPHIDRSGNEFVSQVTCPLQNLAGYFLDVYLKF